MVTTPRQYWGKIKDREFQQLELSPIWVQLKLPSADGKNYKTDCPNTEYMFRIIQSIPSPKAEPFKRWLAKVGYERIQEIENPELAQDMVKEYYELKGYPEDWIDKRLRGIAIRQDLTDEWKTRGVQEKKDFAILNWSNSTTLKSAMCMPIILLYKYFLITPLLSPRLVIPYIPPASSVDRGDIYGFILERSCTESI